MESIKGSGDSGGSATVELDDGNGGFERVLIGVGSFAVDPIYEYPEDEIHSGYTYIGGL